MSIACILADMNRIFDILAWAFEIFYGKEFTFVQVDSTPSTPFAETIYR